MEFSLGLVCICTIDQYLLDVCMAFTFFSLKNNILQGYVGAPLLKNKVLAVLDLVCSDS